MTNRLGHLLMIMTLPVFYADFVTNCDLPFVHPARNQRAIVSRGPCLRMRGCSALLAQLAAPSLPKFHFIFFWRLAVLYVADGWEHPHSMDTPAVCAGSFAPCSGRSSLCAGGRIDLLSQATKQWAESRNACDYDTNIDLHYGPFDDGL